MSAWEDGYREPKASWLGLLRDSKARGMLAPVVAVGDGVLGFSAAVREVWPETREQRCWVHKLANALDKLPKSCSRAPRRPLHEVMYAPDRATCERQMAKFAEEYQAKYPKEEERE